MDVPRAPEDGWPLEEAVITFEPSGATRYDLPVRFPRSRNWVLVIRCGADGSATTTLRKTREQEKR